MAADFLYSTVPSLRSKRAHPRPSAAAALQSGPQYSLRLFEEQDSLAKALLQKKPVYTAAMQAQEGVQADLTSPDRHHHFLAPAASDAPPHWSGTCQFTIASCCTDSGQSAAGKQCLCTTCHSHQQAKFSYDWSGVCAAEQKLIHRQAKDALQGRSLPAGPATVRQKLFGNTLQGFAAAEHQLHKAYPASSSVSLARPSGLVTANPQAALPNETKAVKDSKREDCMDHFVSKKPRHSSGSSNNKMPSKMAFDAAEKLMQNMCTSAAAEE